MALGRQAGVGYFKFGIARLVSGLDDDDEQALECAHAGLVEELQASGVMLAAARKRPAPATLNCRWLVASGQRLPWASSTRVVT